jgi:hypothetical protein
MKRRFGIVTVAVVVALLAVAVQPLLAQNGNTWAVQYYNNPDWSGSPVAATYSSYIDFNWGTAPPAAGMSSTNWTATMTSSVVFNTGTYVFQMVADDEIVLQIDGLTYLSTVGAGMSGKTVQVSVSLTQGTHDLVVQYRQYSGTAYVYLNWAYVKPEGGYTYNPLPVPMPAGTPVTPAPGSTPTPACDPWWSCSCPTQATSVTTQYGDYTPCIQQNLHQANCFQSDGQWDSPDTGSIQSEPQIQVWANCTPSAYQCMQVACNQEPVEVTCSKTAAGWFYYGPCPSGAVPVQ